MRRSGGHAEWCESGTGQSIAVMMATLLRLHVPRTPPRDTEHLCCPVTCSQIRQRRTPRSCRLGASAVSRKRALRDMGGRGSASQQWWYEARRPTCEPRHERAPRRCLADHTLRISHHQEAGSVRPDAAHVQGVSQGGARVHTARGRYCGHGAPIGWPRQRDSLRRRKHCIEPVDLELHRRLGIAANQAL